LYFKYDVSGVLSNIKYDFFVDLMAKSEYIDPMLTAKVCKAARELLEMSQDDLVTASGVSISTIRDFERKDRRPSKSVIDKIRNAFLSNGVELSLSENRVRLSVERDVE
jgi:predicted transcriptional regulator